MGVVGLGGGAGRGGCVTLVWVLPGHRGGRQAEQGGRRRRTADSLLPFPCSFHSFHRLSLASTCPFREAVIKSSFFNIPHFNISSDRSEQTCSCRVPAKLCLSAVGSQRPGSVLRSRPREGKAVKLRRVFLLGFFGIFLPIRSRGCSRGMLAPSEPAAAAAAALIKPDCHFARKSGLSTSILESIF